MEWWPWALFFFLAVILVAQTSITIRAYSINATPKDTNYYWSIFVLVASILSMFFSVYKMIKSPGGAAGAVSAALAGQGDFLEPVDVQKLVTTGTPQDVETLMTSIQKTASRMKEKVDLEAAMKQRALAPLLETIQARMTGAAEAAAALGAGAPPAGANATV
jgi:hypothetical protein